MPVSAVLPVLIAGFLPLFGAAAPTTAAQAANSWSTAYSNYCTAGGVVVPPPKTFALASAVESAFDPALAGGGPALLLAALLSFWMGLSVPAQTGAVVAFIPNDVFLKNSQPDDATPAQQAQGLANVFHLLTLGSVKVLTGGSTVPLA